MMIRSVFSLKTLGAPGERLEEEIGSEILKAEAELLSAIVAFFSKLRIRSSDVGIKISNRKVPQEVVGRSVIPESSFAAVCVIVDKIEKIPRAGVEKELTALGLPWKLWIQFYGLSQLLGSDNEAVVELKQLFELAPGYGFEDWLQFDASVVRGLAYYTGTVFEAFDRAGTLRAICGGGRYDKLLSTFGRVDTPACGFGFGDAVIVEFGQLLLQLCTIVLRY
ncbi:hypothetical protein MARPO_0059s0001 [Marchantia polymorpha]|uniref:histidine--tRNA ligase n=1 Tax=Marchantia polymorpha TaxID=3197 RepID=A0A2R6WT65_MARPO|nr:hypothetical protein MARPO_0059s0001 [Marchantia polymorpha]|eukprot:PTQ37048.1 hypothetical protein MARPO_0059s0001 [Marchantia polymorpha]